MNKKQSRSGGTPLIIFILLFISLLGAQGFVYWQNSLKTKAIDDKINVLTSKLTDTDLTSRKLLSNDVYQIFVYSHEYKDLNGDPCDSVSVLTLYSSTKMAVLSSSSCLGTGTSVGTYNIVSSTTHATFTASIDQSGYHDSSNNPSELIIDNDGMVISGLLDPGTVFVKK